MSIESFLRAAYVALLATSTFATPVVARAAVKLPAYRTFGDWTVACDNVGDCEARGYTDTGDDSLALRVTRAAGRDALPTFEIINVPQGNGTTLQLDGRPLRLAEGRVESTPGPEMSDPPIRSLRVRGVATLQGLAQSARRATRIGVSGTAVTGSLSGFNAAMLFIDDAQGRVDTPGAIARPGHSTAAVPGPRALPSPHEVRPHGKPLSKKDASRYVRALKALDVAGCDEDALDSEPSVDALDDTQVIASVRCNRGAYQATYAVFVGPRADPERAKPVRLPDPLGADEPDGMLTEASFDTKTGRLSMFARGRGMADCGASGDWTWDGHGFALVSYTLLDRCGWPDPGDFPTLWRSTASEVAR